MVKGKQKNKIEAIIFDIGGVLYAEPMDKHYSALCKTYNLDLKKFYKIRKKYSKKATLGKLSAYEFPISIAKDFDIRDIKEFYRTWIKFREKILKIDKDVEQTILKLKKQHYIIGTFSNVTKTNDQIRMKKNIYKYFKIKLISNRAGLKKPDLRFYKLLIKKLNFPPQEIIYVDDERKYLKPAKKLGIKTILFKNAKQLKKDLKKFGVEI